MRFAQWIIVVASVALAGCAGAPTPKAPADAFMAALHGTADRRSPATSSPTNPYPRSRTRSKASRW